MEGNKIIILDTSVLIKWIVDETEGMQEAQELKHDHHEGKIKVLMPSISLWEVGNYLGRKFEAREAAEIFQTFRLSGMEEVQINEKVAHRAFQIMKSAPKVSFYDASYHALAIESGGTYITADEKYYQKAKKWRKIQLLQDYRKRVK